MTKIVIHENCLSERGTTTASYNYAYYIREILNFEPIVAFDTKYNNEDSVVEKFRNQFELFPYENFQDVQRLIDSKNIEFFYGQKYGNLDNILVNNATNLIHSVFSSDPNHIHGDRYAVISEWMTLKSGGRIPYVPYMITSIDIDQDLRVELGIPRNDTVVGRHGAFDTFNIDFAVDVVKAVLEKRKDIWFLFMNTEQKINHPRCIYLKKTVDEIEKIKFINTCDAMLHARDYGETFGLAVLEFAVRNKQIISYDNIELQNSHPLGGRNHFLYLGDNCFRFKEYNDLGYILMNVNRANPFNTEYLLDKFSPKNVMNIFKRVFLS
jgi:hypothetical protein